MQLPPPGLTVRYEAGASLQSLARSYRMSVKTVRALLVSAGVQIRPPGRRKRTGHSSGTTANAARSHPAPADTAELATVHQLRLPPTGHADFPIDEDPPIWPTFDLDPPPQPRAQPLAPATPGQPCIGYNTPHLVHVIADRPVSAKAGDHTAAMTRCGRVGLVDAPIPPEAQVCAACHPAC
ncbi:hypothetical protein SacmaDRAFT_4200 [Saccharomonospora marina XMU15]|uniref:Uncharacterized protein n=2 Tax=Saccharomonospora TaxID=1851 RepID=H5X6W4_9PSEU|nr:hypothetical protein SacmaDRAFT_4200 [Saccharomonospora marina XMU15]